MRILKRGEVEKSEPKMSKTFNERNEPQPIKMTENEFYPIDQTINSGLSMFENAPLISSLPTYISAKIFKSLGLDPSMDPYIRILHRFDNLMLFHYYTKNVLPIAVSHVRGIILDMAWDDGDLYPIVCRSFPFTPEYNCNSKHLEEVLKECDKTPVITTSITEGTIIRIYTVLTQSIEGNPVTKWYVSTLKNINGTHNKIRNMNKYITFGSIINNIWGPEPYSEYLKPVGTHTFVLNQKYVKSDDESNLDRGKLEYTIQYTGTFSVEGILSYDGFIKPHLTIKGSPKLSLKNLDNVTNFMSENINCMGVLMQFKGRGIQTFNIPTFDGEKPKHADGFIKVINPLYVKTKVLKGTSPNLAIKYIELNVEHRKELKRNYPAHIELFNNYDIWLSTLPHYLASCYTERYVKNKHLTLPSYDHFIVSRTYTFYNENLTITGNIEEILKTSTAYQKYIMINNMISSPFYNK